MIWTISYSLHCDTYKENPECHNLTDEQFSKKDAKKWAIAQGWKLAKTFVHCPSCQAKVQADSDAVVAEVKRLKAADPSWKDGLVR